MDSDRRGAAAVYNDDGALSPVLELQGPRERVLYIGGAGRSGSTLLALILNSLPGFVAVGELRFIWLQGVQQNLLCACGQPFLSCDFWSAVGESAFGGWDQVDAERVMNLLGRVDRHRFVPLLWRPSASDDFRQSLAEYRALVARVYRAVSEVSGSEVVVDSTKDAPFALVLSQIPEIDFRVIHLVRDSRGVAYSRMKRKRRPEVVGAEAFMEQFGPVSVSLGWNNSNVLMHAMARKGAPRLEVKYEDLVTRPRDEIWRIVRFAGLGQLEDDLASLISHKRALSPNHSIAGNPIRFDDGPVRLKVDDEWRSSMRAGDRLLVTALTAPLLRRYGYLARRPRWRGSINPESTLPR